MPGSSTRTGTPGQYKGVLVDSVVVFVVRKGNPKNIHTWDDLTKVGVEVITPNPFTSGGARWNVMAAYGAQLKQGKTPAEAEQYLYDLFKNVPVQDDSARNALATFTGGKGDVLLSYENEAILAQAKGEDVDYVVPDQTIKIETVAAVTKSAPPAAQKWLDWLYTPEAQKIFADNGYRPVVSGVTGQVRLPDPAAGVHDRRARRLEQGQGQVLRRPEGHHGQGGAVDWRLDHWIAPFRRRGTSPPPPPPFPGWRRGRRSSTSASLS